MKKCEKCGREVWFPFTCSYCSKEYCKEHRLPESHDCSNIADAKSPSAPPAETPRLGLCPKCHSAKSDMIDYDAETMTFKCRWCGFKYSQLKAYPHDYREPAGRPEPPEPKTRKSFPVRKIIGLLLVITIIGVFLWCSPIIISMFQDLSHNTSSQNPTN